MPVPIAEDGTWTYTMTNLKAGRYSVSVHGMDGKLSTGSSDIDFYVTGENSLPKPIVSAATDGYEITFTLEPGTGVTAEEIEWTVCRTDEHGERTSRWESADENGGCVIDQYVGPYTNTYTFTIVYCADGVYSEPEEYVWNVEGSPYPINGEIPVDLDVPETWEAGNDMALSWTPVVEGQHLEINLYKAFTDEWLWGDSEDASSVEEITFVIDGNLLDDGQYLIRLNSDADTYESVNKKYYFTVIDNRPEGPEITLSADKIKVGEYVYATVTLPEDREEILAVQTGMNMYQYHVRNGSIIPIEQESLGVYTYRFRLKTENGWTKPTEKIITVELAGKIPRVDYKTLVTWPARITAGQDVTITVKKITGVDHYSVSVYGNGFRHNENFDGTQVTIPGVLFEAGDNIQIRVYAYVKGLYEAIGDGEECAAKAYTVAGSASLADPITISAENTTVYVNGYTKIFLDRPAEKIILMTKEPGLDIWKTTGRWFDGSWEEVEVSFWTDGPAQVRLTAFINGKWTQWSNELSFMVNPVIGLLECPEVTAAQAGNCLHVSWSAVDHAESYYIQVYMTTSHKWYSWWIQNGATEHSIPVSKIGEGSGYVFVLSEGTGYESDYSNQRRALFTVKALKIPDDGVHTPEALTVIEAEAFAGIDAKKIIIPETCTEIRSRAFADIETLEEVWILGMNTVVAGDAFEECGNVVIMTPEGSKAEGILDGKPNITIEHIP